MKSFLAFVYVVEPSLHVVGTPTRSTFWRCGDFSSLIDKLAISFGPGAFSEQTSLNPGFFRSPVSVIHVLKYYSANILEIEIKF
jgi:hypothetical protein